jgi:uncharacterized protein (DUF302 family)
MIKKRLIGFVFLLTIGFMANAAELVTKPSAAGVKETMDKLESIVKAKGLTVFLRVDHQANAAKVDLTMPAAQVLIFGNPKMGTSMMKADIRAGLDLPLRVLVYEDSAGKTWISYHNPQELKEDYQLADSPAVAKAEQALDKMTSGASQP